MTNNSDWQAAIIEVLDKNKPRWWIEWADRGDLVDLLESQIGAGFIGGRKPDIKSRIAQRLFHPILNAALEAGVVAQPAEAKAP